MVVSFAQAIPDGVPQGLGLAGFLAVAGFAWRIQRQVTKAQDERIRHQDKRIEGLEAEGNECRWRLNRLVQVISEFAPAVIPDDFWGPPPWVQGEGRRVDDP